jgi:hypothetical protein
MVENKLIERVTDHRRHLRVTGSVERFDILWALEDLEEGRGATKSPLPPTLAEPVISAMKKFKCVGTRYSHWRLKPITGSPQSLLPAEPTAYVCRPALHKIGRYFGNTMERCKSEFTPRRGAFLNT